MSEALSISASGVTIARGSKIVLKNISFEIPRGCLTAIIGPNGAGKTSLMRTLAGLDQVVEGSLSFSNQSCPTKLTTAQRSKLIGWLPPQSSLPFDFRVEDIVVMGRYPWHLGYPTAEDWLEATKAMQLLAIEPLRQLPVTRLSSGQQQRVMLARLLSSKAPLKLLDEPTTFLDLKAQKTTMSALKSLTLEKTTIVAATNNINLASRYSDYAILIDNKSNLRHGLTPDILSPESIYQFFEIKTKKIEVDSFIQFINL